MGIVFFILALIVVGIASSKFEERGEGSFGCFRGLIVLMVCFAFPPLVPIIIILALLSIRW